MVTFGQVSSTTDMTAAAIPTGVILPWAGTSTTAPTGFLFCDGASYGTAAQPTLFATTGYTFGGAGANFNVPDLNGRAPIGQGTASGGSTNRVFGTKYGAETHTLATSEMPSHSHGGATGTESADHTHTIPNHAHGLSSVPQWTGSTVGAAAGGLGPYPQATGAGVGATNTDGGGGATSGRSAVHTHAITAEGGGGSHNNMQPSLAVKWIIKT